MYSSMHRKTAAQFYNDMSDHLAALRSANGWFTFVILVLLVGTVFFNVFFTVRSVDGVSIKGSPVSVVASSGGAESLSRGDVALIHDGGRYFCVRVKKKEGSSIVALKGSESVSYSDNVIEGKVFFVVQPLIAFADRPERACAEF